MEYFYTVEKYRKAELKIKRSVFICHLAQVTSIAGAKKFISEKNTEYKTANHNCWAYIIGKKAEIYHSSDAGEPSGTAGQPMLNTLKKHNMSNVVAVVTRFFGGVKLGIRGLIEAYETSVESAVQQAPLNKIIEKRTFSFSLSYDLYETVRYKAQKAEANIESEDFSEKVSLKISIEKHKAQFLEIFFNELAIPVKFQTFKYLIFNELLNSLYCRFNISLCRYSNNRILWFTVLINNQSRNAHHIIFYRNILCIIYI